MEFKKQKREVEVKKQKIDIIEEKLMKRKDFDAEYARLVFSSKIKPFEIVNLVDKLKDESQIQRVVDLVKSIRSNSIKRKILWLLQEKYKDSDDEVKSLCVSRLKWSLNERKTDYDSYVPKTYYDLDEKEIAELSFYEGMERALEETMEEADEKGRLRLTNSE
ncbi:MAG: hypothetical protein QXF07_02190 [Candidatus Micrarchaeia archaeon]